MSNPSRPPLYAPISLGELVDRVSILEIKCQRVRDPARRRVLAGERDLLLALLAEQGIGTEDETSRALGAVNRDLWELEDRIRAKERDQTFDGEFIEIARGIYRLNDQRHALKRGLDVAWRSPLVAEKEYGGPDGG